MGTAADRWRISAPPRSDSVGLWLLRAARRFHVEVKAGAQALSRRVAPESKTRRNSRPFGPFSSGQSGFVRSSGRGSVTLRRRSPSSSALRSQPSLAGWSLIEVCAPAAIELWAC